MKLMNHKLHIALLVIECYTLSKETAAKIVCQTYQFDLDPKSPSTRYILSWVEYPYMSKIDLHVFVHILDPYELTLSEFEEIKCVLFAHVNRA